MSYEDRDFPVKKNIIRLPSAPKIFRISDCGGSEDKLRDRIGNMVNQGYQERDTLEKKGLIRKIRIHQDYFNDQININLNFLKGGIETYKSNFMYKFYLNKAHNKLSTCNY